MKGERFLSLDDYEAAAQRILPRPIFGYVESGVETRAALDANKAAFQTVAFVTRVLRDVSKRSLATPLLGKAYSAPFGIAPMGLCALAAYRGDIDLAAAAKAADIPMIISGASLVRLEDIAKTNPDAWFQGYFFGDNESISRMLERVENANIQTLVVTVDAQGSANRENFVRNGFSTPLRPSFGLALDGLSHPRWLTNVLLRTLLLHGMPHFENSSHERGAPIISSSAQRQFSGRSRFSWEHIRYIRDRWKGNLVIKGILSLEDTFLAKDYGADAVVLSNHGGRQLDCAISAFALLPHIMRGKPEIPILIDGGFRRGTDIVKALAMGAAFVLVGRPFTYAAAVSGEKGVLRAIYLLVQEISRNIGMIGLTDIRQLDSSCLRRSDGSTL